LTARAGIIGLGLLGGSLAKALRSKGGLSYIAAMDNDTMPLEQARADGVIDAYVLPTDEAAFQTLFGDCDIVFICAPVDQIPGYVHRLRGVVRADCLLTDVGSVKASLWAELQKHPGVNFIGGHPMAGSEKTGYRHSIDSLFENAFFIFTPLPWVSAAVVESFAALLQRMGAIPLVMDAALHDETVAAISHGPHVVAAALVNLVRRLDSKDQYMHTLAAGGFKDLTRIASSGAEMWAAIAADNAEALTRFLEKFRNELDIFAQTLSRGKNDLIAFFESAKSYRDSFSGAVPGAYRKSFEIRVDVEDRPGSIATLATMLSVNGVNIKNIGVLHSREYESGVLQIAFDSEEDQNKSIALLRQMNYSIYGGER
jgi:prephenate dehydrogenase